MPLCLDRMELSVENCNLTAAHGYIQWPVPTQKSGLCTSLPGSALSDVMFIACRQPQWEYLHHGNWPTLEIRTLHPES